MANKRANREELFAREYLVDLNGKRAAIAAGYSESTAEAQASRLLRKSKVKELIAELAKAKCDKLEIKADDVLAELKKLGFSNLLDYMRVDADGQMDVDFSRLTREQAVAMQEIIVDTTGGTGDGERRQVLRTRFKLADKLRALELLGKYLKLFTEKVEVTASEELAALIAEGRKQAAQRR